MRMMVMLTFDINTQGDAAMVIREINPPALPGFDGKARVVLGDTVAVVEKFVDE